MYKPTIAIILDTRRATKDKTYPLKLRATWKVGERGKKKWDQKYFSLRLLCSKADFKAAGGTGRLTDEQKRIRKVVLDADRTSQKILDDHTVVTYELFKKLFVISSALTVGDVFNLIMREKLESGDVGTFNAYKTARNSFARFVDPNLPKLKTRKTKTDTIKLSISFMEVDKGWIEKYKKWAAEDGAGKTSITIYLRHLRAVYNRGIDMHLIKQDMYPFGKSGVQLKKTKARKHRLNEEDIRTLLASSDPEFQFGVDFWAFSFYSYGLNMMDIALLLKKDIHDDLIVIERAKTEDTGDGRLLVIPLRKEAKEIISRRGNKTLNPNDYVFPILSKGLSPMQIKNRVNDFIGRVNSDLKKAQEKLKLSTDPKSGNARHSFASLALEKGASKEFIQEALGHTSMQTTEDYLSGFGVKIKKAIGAKIYDS